MRWYLYRIDSGSFRARPVWRAHLEGLDGEMSLCGRAPETGPGTVHGDIDSAQGDVYYCVSCQARARRLAEKGEI